MTKVQISKSSVWVGVLIAFDVLVADLTSAKECLEKEVAELKEMSNYRIILRKIFQYLEFWGPFFEQNLKNFNS